MKLQLNRNIKVFVTTNLDLDNTVLLSGLTRDNTKQILVQSGTLSVSQSKEYSYIDNYSLIDGYKNLESIAKPTLSLGTLDFSTYMNTSKAGPFDVWLWNSLATNESYPGYKWNTTSSGMGMQLVRTDTKVLPLGILLVSDSMVYVLDGVRIAGVNVSFDLSDFVINAWKTNFDKLRIINSSYVTELTDGFSFNGGLSGFAEKIEKTNYNYCPAKLLLIDIYNSNNEEKLGSLAATGFSINITNSLNYIENNTIDRTSLYNLFTSAGAYIIEGTMSFYIRGSGSFANTLLNNIVSLNNNHIEASNYSLKITMPHSKTKNICSIQLVSCNLSANSSFDDVLTANVSFKLLDSIYTDNCFIKFYT